VRGFHGEGAAIRRTSQRRLAARAEVATCSSRRQTRATTSRSCSRKSPQAGRQGPGACSDHPSARVARQSAARPTWLPMGGRADVVSARFRFRYERQAVATIPTAIRLLAARCADASKQPCNSGQRRPSGPGYGPRRRGKRRPQRSEARCWFGSKHKRGNAKTGRTSVAVGNASGSVGRRRRRWRRDGRSRSIPAATRGHRRLSLRRDR
jgi:hypothetical protein